MTTYLHAADLIAAATVFLGEEPKIRDLGLLESALARPGASMLGTEAYPTIHEKAAALLLSLTNNHALVDGNKRLGFVATALFYALNGLRLKIGFDEGYDLVMAIADGSQRDVQEVARILEAATVERQ